MCLKQMMSRSLSSSAQFDTQKPVISYCHSVSLPSFLCIPEGTKEEKKMCSHEKWEYAAQGVLYVS